MEYIRGLFNLKTVKEDKFSWFLFMCIVVVIPYGFSKLEASHKALMDQHEKSCTEMKTMMQNTLEEYKGVMGDCSSVVRQQDSIIAVQNEQIKTLKKIKD